MVPVWAVAQAAKLSPLDKVRLECTEEPGMNRDYKVTKDGMILLDFLGAVDIGGLTESEAGAKIGQRLVDERILRKATVTVKIVEPATKPAEQTPPAQPKEDAAPPIKVSLGGAVKQAGAVTLPARSTLRDLLETNPALETADLTKVTVTTTDGTVKTVDATKDAQATVLTNDDTVIVPVKEEPKPAFVSVLGGVKKPGSVQVTPGMTVKQAIDECGGFTNTSSGKKVTLERNGEPARQLDLSVATDDVALMADDKLSVTVTETRAYVAVEGAVRNPGYVVFAEGMKLSEAFSGAGGLSADAKQEKIKIVPVNGKPRTIDYAAVAQGYSGDHTLAAGDRIIVPGQGKKGLSKTKIAIGAAAVWLLFGR